MDPVTIGYIIAGVQLAIAAYGNYKSQQAAEDAAEAEAERRANLARLARLKFAHQQGIAVDQLAKLDKKSIRERDVEKNVILAKKIQQKKIEGTVAANSKIMSGRSSSFYRDRITGDLLRGQDAIKEDFLVKRLEVHSKKEAVMQGLQTDRINMQYGKIIRDLIYSIPKLKLFLTSNVFAFVWFSICKVFFYSFDDV